jgi:putative endonuclease
MMTFTVYVLYSDLFCKHYTGFTTNLDQRLISHNELGNDWTRSFRPWRLIYTKEFIEKAEAIKYEKWLKSGVGRDFIRSIPH